MGGPWENYQSSDGPWSKYQEKSSGPSAIQSMATGAMNNFPLGPQIMAGVGNVADKIANKLNPDVPAGGYSGELEQFKNDAQTAKAAHPVAYGAGAVGGTLAPLAIPGVGEALEASPIMGNAVLGAANAVSDTDLSKNPGDIAKKAGIGAVIGGGTAGVLGKVLPSTEGLEDLASKKAIQSVEMPKGIVGKMAPEGRDELGSFIQQNGLVGMDKTQVLEKARGLSDQFGKKIGEIADKAGDEGLRIDPAEHYQAMRGLLDKADQFKGLSNREAKSLARDYTAGANDILNLPEYPSWNDIQRLKEQYGNLAFKSSGEVKSEGAKDTYFALKDMLTKISEKAQSSNLAPEYKEALSSYSKMQPIETGLENAVDSELRGGGAGMGVRGLTGLIKKLPGPVRAVAGPMAAVMGHPILGAAAALPELMNPAFQSKAAAGAAKVMPQITQGATQGVSKEIQDYIKRRYQQ